MHEQPLRHDACSTSRKFPYKDLKAHFNYGLTPQTIQSSLSYQDALAWDEHFIAKLRTQDVTQNSDDCEAFPDIPHLNLVDEDSSAHAVTADWMRPVRCIVPEALRASHPEYTFCELASSNPEDIPIFKLKDGCLNFKDAYREHYASMKP